MKYRFINDYSEIAHPSVLELWSSVSKQYVGYSCDEETSTLQTYLRDRFQSEVDVHLFASGTLTNLTVISSILRPFEAVISCDTGHINVHETGAIEGTGHKVLTVPNLNGKMTIPAIQKILDSHVGEHMVKPSMVYISNATEIGTIYQKQELKALKEFCEKNQLFLFLDGARLGSALMSYESDLTLEDIQRYTDAFYIGGTKNGLPYGELVVLTHPSWKQQFRYHLKNRGGLLAKGFVLSMAFHYLLKTNLFFDMAAHANACANYIQEELIKLNVRFLVKSATNQIFPILSKNTLIQLKKHYDFELWEAYDETHDVVRFVTSWATPQSICQEFIEDVKHILCEQS